jgi:protein-disulfide isomerase
LANSSAAKRDKRVSGRAQRRIREEQARKRNIYFALGAIAVAILVVAAAVYLATRDDGDDSDQLPIVAANSDITAPVDGRIAGEPDAIVSVVEWGDYQCPACAAFHREAKPMLIEEYVNTGEVSFEFRDFAFLGPESYKAAEAAWCAEDQGKFWEYHDTLYLNQGGENSGALSDSRLKDAASAVGLDEAQFNECFDNRVHEDDVISSYEDGSALGVNSTPTLVIDGELVRYAGNDDLRARLDEALSA